jgi:dipeptidase E
MEFLEHARKPIREFLGPDIKRVAFVPYAAVSFEYDEYADLVARHFEDRSIQIDSTHRFHQPADALRDAQAIVVGGGNTFRLLQELLRNGLLEAVRERVLGGTPYLGWSAGSNVACPTIRTTNDMPIVDPGSLESLHLIPFQINPHYLDAHPEGHQGETREQRIEEFIALNPDVFVVGLREGSALKVTGSRVELIGSRPMRLFCRGRPATEMNPGADFSFLLQNA